MLSGKASRLSVTQISVMRTKLGSFCFSPFVGMFGCRVRQNMVVHSRFSDDKNNNMGYSVDAVANRSKHHQSESPSGPKARSNALDTEVTESRVPF